MKNGTCVKECYYCWHCKTSGFFCYTPMGADFKTCPCCGENIIKLFASRLLNNQGRLCATSTTQQKPIDKQLVHITVFLVPHIFTIGVKQQVSIFI